MADDPAEELFAAAAVEEAAMVGFCAFEMDALIRNRWGGFGVKVENVVAGAVQSALVTSLISDRRVSGCKRLRIKSLLRRARPGCRIEEVSK